MWGYWALYGDRNTHLILINHLIFKTMRKLFTTLKSLVAVAIVASMTLSSCSYDDSAINKRVDKIEKDLASLTERVAALEEDLANEVDALTALIEDKVGVTAVDTEDGVTTVTLDDGTEFTITGDGSTSGDDLTLAVQKDGDVYYWAVFKNGKFVEYLTVDEQKVPVFQELPELKFSVDETDGTLLMSIDGGKTWVDSNLAAEQVSGASVFAGVVVNEDGTVTFTLADNTTTFTVALAKVAALEFAKEKVYVPAGETKSIAFTVGEDVADVSVMNLPQGWKANVVVAEDGAYALEVVAPKKEAVASEVAVDGGDVALHVTTATGTCKVAKLPVELAQIKVEVDAEGNITVTNSLAAFVSRYDHFEGVMVEGFEFTPYYIGLMPLQYYTGELTLDDVYNMAGTYSNNLVNTPYEEGVCEVQILNTSVAYILEEMYYQEVGTDSYLVFVSPLDDNYNPSIEEAVTAMFKQPICKIENSGIYTHKDAYLYVNLVGAEETYFAYVSKPELTEYYDGDIDIYTNYILGAFNAGQASYFFYGLIPGDIYGKEMSVCDIFHYGLEEEFYYMTLDAGTEYYLVALPIFEKKDAYTSDDVVVVEFKTEDIVEAVDPIDYTVTEVEEETSISTVGVTVTLGEDVDYAKYLWVEAEYTDLELLMEEVKASGNYVTSGQPFVESVDAPDTTIYLALLVVNVDGEYKLVQLPFTTDAIEYTDTISIESVSFANGKATIDVKSNGERTIERARYIAYTKAAADADTTLEAQLAKLCYDSQWSSSVFPITANYLTGRSYTRFVEGETYYIAVAAKFTDGTYSQPVYGEYKYEAAPAETEGESL